MPVFSLQDAKIEQIKNVAYNNFSYWEESATYGYFCGGFTTVAISNTDRLDISTETVTTPGLGLPTARERIAATASPSYGYFGGGNPIVCVIYRLEFSTETVSTPTPQLSQPRLAAAAVSSGVYAYGYFAGGSNATPAFFSSIDRIDFSTETVTTPANRLSQGKRGLAAASTNLYGYFGGGYFTPVATRYSTIDRLDLTTEVISTPAPKLSAVKNALGATSSTSYGYFGGGTVPTATSIIDRIDFTNETVTTPGVVLTEAKSNLPAISSSSYGYFAGGNPVVCTIDRLDFSTELRASLASGLPAAKYGMGAVSAGQSILRGNKTYGYFGGGANYSAFDRLDFSTETVSTPSRSRLSTDNLSLTATSSISISFPSQKDGHHSPFRWQVL